MLAALVALALAAPAVPDDKQKELTEAAKKDLKQLEGGWKGVKVVKDGAEWKPPGDEKYLGIEFKGRTLALERMDLFEVAAVDTTADPKGLDLKTLTDAGPFRKGAVYKSAYKLDDDTLTLAFVEDGASAKRPTKLESMKGSKIVLITFERQKK